VKTSEELIQAAEDAIMAVFSDTRVSQNKTIANLAGLCDEINRHIDSIEADIAREEGDQ
jgi:hemerythrin-like domain-containing protein